MEKSRNQTGRLRSYFRRKDRRAVTLTVPEKDGVFLGPPELGFTPTTMNEIHRRMQEDMERTLARMTEQRERRIPEGVYYTPTGYYAQQAARVG